MIRRNSAISFLFIGLITLSLSVSTIHSHSAIQASVHESNHPGIEHSIEKDATFCPVCGTLDKLQIAAPVSAGLVDLEAEPMHAPDLTRHESIRPGRARGRSPPPGG